MRWVGPISMEPAWASTQMASLEVAEPYVGMTVQRSSVEQGKETDVVVEVQVVEGTESSGVGHSGRAAT